MTPDVINPMTIRAIDLVRAARRMRGGKQRPHPAVAAFAAVFTPEISERIASSGISAAEAMANARAALALFPHVGDFLATTIGDDAP
jgi:hypothetical protein